jgi:membrane protein DedA with SNARE-associated domain
MERIIGNIFLMNIAAEPIFQFLAQYAYEPHFVYLGIVGMMIASGFGVPVPEELTIVSVGILTYMGANPDMFPPPFPGAPVVNGYEAAAVTLFAVVFADFLVFGIGRFAGRKIIQKPMFRKVFNENVMGRINGFLKKYGVFAAFMFRFTPGIRFPAHVMLGMSNFPAWQFGIVDGMAAIISVPTQILLIYHFGEPILSTMAKFKFYFLLALVGLILFVGVRKAYQWYFTRPPRSGKHLSP